MAATKTDRRPAGAGARPAPAPRARRASVLEAALDCFSRQGVEGTTIGDIQRAARCSVGSLYHHFGSKEGIAEELFIDGIARFNRGMLRRLRQALPGAEESVKAVVRFYCDWSTRNRALASYLHSRDIDFSEQARERLKAEYRSYITQVFAWFAPFVASGEMRALPPDAYVPLISGPIQEYVRRWLSGSLRAPAGCSEGAVRGRRLARPPGGQGVGLTFPLLERREDEDAEAHVGVPDRCRRHGGGGNLAVHGGSASR
jgi:AcrR family transcriptional regulator